MTEHKVGTRKEWLAARTALLAGKKELTRRGDELALKRHALPWVPVEKDYSFEADEGTKTPAGLFHATARPLPAGRGDDPEGWPRRHDEYE